MGGMCGPAQTFAWRRTKDFTGGGISHEDSQWSTAKTFSILCRSFWNESEVSSKTCSLLGSGIVRIFFVFGRHVRILMLVVAVNLTSSHHVQACATFPPIFTIQSLAVRKERSYVGRRWVTSFDTFFSDHSSFVLVNSKTVIRQWNYMTRLAVIVCSRRSLQHCGLLFCSFLSVPRKFFLAYLQVHSRRRATRILAVRRMTCVQLVTDNDYSTSAGSCESRDQTTARPSCCI